MIYSIPNIITWAKMCQAYSSIGEAKSRATIGGSVDHDLHIKLYNTRLDVEYEYAQDPSSDNLYGMSNYLLMLCGKYLMQAQNQTGNGGSISPVSPSSSTPAPYDFIVSTTSFIIGGQTSKTINAFIGYNILFVRNNVTQSTVDNGGTYYSWDSNTGLFVIYGGDPQDGELFQIYAV